MNRSVGLVFLVAGIVLIGYGIVANDSVSSGISRLFTGAPTDKTIFLLFGGIVLSVLGALSLRSRN